jgi:voltage-gated potassium channel
MHRVLRRLARPTTALCTALTLVLGGAAAAVAVGTAPSYPRGVWWSLSLITTEGFVGGQPHSAAGWLLAGLLMVVGLLLVTLISATLASLLVQREERSPFGQMQRADDRIEALLVSMNHRLERLEAKGRVESHDPGRVRDPMPTR